MQCRQIRTMLLNYAIDDTRVTERLCVDVHITHCPACRQELEDLCELVHASDRALAHPAPKDDFDALMARISAEEAAHRAKQVNMPPRWKSVAFQAGAAAAVIAILLCTAPLLRQTEQVVDNFRDATTITEGGPPESIQLPKVTQPFIEHMQTLERGEYQKH